MGKVESSKSFLPPSDDWAGAQCCTADQKENICFLTSLYPSPVKEAKVTEQRGYPICHPSPATTATYPSTLRSLKYSNIRTIMY